MTSRSRARRQRSPLQVEMLESRITPTAFRINDFRVVYRDLDNDLVLVRASQPIFTVGDISTIFTFTDVGGTDVASSFELVNPPVADPAYLRVLDLNGVAATNLSISVAVISQVGDGLAEVGKIDSSSNGALNFKRILVKGRLYELDTGAGIRSLTVGYLGTGNPSNTDASDYGTTTSQSDIATNVGAMLVLNNIDNSFFNVTNILRKGVVLGDVGIDPLGAQGSTAADNGAVLAGDSIGSFQIRGNLFGGDGDRSGSIRGGVINSVQVKKDVVGGSGVNSGWIRSEDTILHVGIGGSLLGGRDIDSGEISAVNHIKSVIIQQNVVGGSAADSGKVISESDGIDLVRIVGSIIGGDATNAGSILVANDLLNLQVLGGLQGGIGLNSAHISADNIVKLRIGPITGGYGITSATVNASSDLTDATILGDITGGVGDGSGMIGAGDDIKKLTVQGSVKGGSGVGSGLVFSAGTIFVAAIRGDLVGGEGNVSGRLFGLEQLVLITVFGSVIGGEGSESGVIATEGNASGRIIVVEDVVGFGADSGAVFIGGFINNLLIGGDLDGGFVAGGDTMELVEIRGSILGGAFPFAGSVQALDTIDSIIVRKSILAGTEDDTGAILSEVDITKVLVGEDIDGRGGLKLSDQIQVGPRAGRIAAAGNIGSVQINGSIFGGNNDDTGEIIADAEVGETVADGAGDIGKIKLIGSLRGGSSFGGPAGQVVTNAGCILAVNIGDLGGPNTMDGIEIFGSVSAGANGGADLFNSGAIRASGMIDNVFIHGILHGNLLTRPVISALDEITKLTVAGDCLYADILVGYGTDIYAVLEPSGDVDALNRPVNGVFLLDFDNAGLPVDTNDATEFNGSAVLGDIKLGMRVIASNVLVSVDPGVDTVVGTSDDVMNSGVITKARFNNFVRGEFIAGGVFEYVVAAATITSMVGKSDAGTFTEADAPDINIDPPFNILTGLPLDFTSDTLYYALYT